MSSYTHFTLEERKCLQEFLSQQDKRILILEEMGLRAKERFRILTRTGYPT